MNIKSQNKNGSTNLIQIKNYSKYKHIQSDVMRREYSQELHTVLHNLAKPVFHSRPQNTTTSKFKIYDINIHTQKHSCSYSH